jgi:hypothetical protein
MIFHCRPLNGNGKINILCALCAFSEAGGEYKPPTGAEKLAL